MTNPALPRLATEQHGVLTRPQLLNGGVGPDTIDRWVRGGRLIRLHQGVYALGHRPPSPHARTMAAVLACGDGAVLSHRSAGKLYGLIRYTGPVEITARTRRRRPGVIVHENKLTDRDVTEHWGIPTTSPARTLTGPRPRPHPRLPHPRSKRRAARPPPCARRPPGQVRKPAEATNPLAFEDAFRSFCARHRLPQPEINAVVAGYEVDAYWPANHLVVELDGEDFDQDFESDRAKDADLVEAGLRVVRVTWDRLTHQPRREAARFRTLLSEGSSPRRRSGPTARAAPRRHR